jgi:hypothetical protein
MKNIYITFGGSAYDSTTQLIVERAKDFGADEFRVYDDRWLIDTAFFRVNHWIFDREPRMGFGWCCWKPYLFLHQWLRIPNASVADNDDTVILYTDADTYPISDLRPLFDRARKEGVMLFEEQGCINGMWTRSDCWDAMGMVPQPETQHACGRFQLFRAGWPLFTSFMRAWQRYSLEPECQFHEGSQRLEDAPNFMRHSAEQSVLSLLALKYSIPLHRTPDQNGWPVAEGKEDWYPQIFVQEGTRGDVRDFSGSRFRNVG